MMHYTQACTLGAILFLAAFSSGCSPENEKQAKIVGKVDTTTKLSPTESKSKGARGVTPQSRPSSYPKPSS